MTCDLRQLIGSAMGEITRDRKRAEKEERDMSKIEWTEKVWNPIVGCSLASPGCTNCYAMSMAHRLGHNPATPHYAGTTRRVNGNTVWTGNLAMAPDHVLTAPLRRMKPTTYFMNSMGDLFHEDVPEDWIDRVFAVMALCPQHKFQVLTKRAARMRDYVLGSNIDRPRRYNISDAVEPIATAHKYWKGDGPTAWDAAVAHALHARHWPLPNVWLSVSVEDQRRADERIPDLLATPAAIRFISAEPLLGPVDISPWLNGCYECAAECGYRAGNSNPPRQEKCHHCGLEGDFLGEFCSECGLQDFGYLCPNCAANVVQFHPDTTILDWVITGGESGPGARPMHPDWARSLRDQCVAAEVPFFFKQWGDWVPGENIIEPRFGYCADAKWWDGKWLFGETRMDDPEDKWDTPADLYRVGKRAAARYLDGREWNEVPTP